MESLITHSINSYTSNLLCLCSAHKLGQDIHKVLTADIMKETFKDHLEIYANKFATESLIVQQLLHADHETMQVFQSAYEDIKNDIAGNYTDPTAEELQEINQKIQDFSKKRKQYDRRIALGLNKKLHVA